MDTTPRTGRLASFGAPDSLAGLPHQWPGYTSSRNLLSNSPSVFLHLSQRNIGTSRAKPCKACIIGCYCEGLPTSSYSCKSLSIYIYIHIYCPVYYIYIYIHRQGTSLVLNLVSARGQIKSSAAQPSYTRRLGRFMSFLSIHHPKLP